MHQTFTYPEYPYRPSPELAQGLARRHPVVVIGAGPVGLTAALDCAVRGLPVVVLDDNNTVSIGSRAVCYAKRPLEIWDRLGGGMAGRQGRELEDRQGVLPRRLTYVDLLPQPATRCRR
jgi:3-(3-hydroxy-phenyl)propionate hydroxylase